MMTTFCGIETESLRVNLGRMIISDRAAVILTAYGLGSCIAVTAWSQSRRVGGLLHFFLPHYERVYPGQHEPTRFADTGIPLLLDEVRNHGGKCSDLVIKAAGGASLMRTIANFDIGARNRLALIAELEKLGVHLAASDVGGTHSRTVSLAVGTGEVTVLSNGSKRLL
jgi:chemotaxis protein CheD